MSNIVTRYAGKVAGNAKGLFDQVKYGRQAAQNNADADTLKRANGYPKNGAKLDASGEPTEGFKARSLGDDAKTRIVARAKAMSGKAVNSKK